MPYVAIVTVLALLEFMWLMARVGKARTQFGIVAPATTGNDIFERHFRVQMNTVEQLILFLPTLWIFARFIAPLWAAAFGLVFILGRAIYAISYVRDPKSRSLGFGLTALPTFIMMIWTLVWAVRALLLTGGDV